MDISNFAVKYKDKPNDYIGVALEPEAGSIVGNKDSVIYVTVVDQCTLRIQTIRGKVRDFSFTYL